MATGRGHAQGRMAGLGRPDNEAFLQQVNQEAAALTKDAKGPFTLPEGLSPGAVAGFCLLDRQLTYTMPLHASRKAPMEFTAGDMHWPVSFFGVTGRLSEEYASTIRVLAWRPIDRSHALEIRCTQAGEAVVLYLPPQPQDFATACRWLRTWRVIRNSDKNNTLGWNDRRLHSKDTVRIPYVAMDVKANLSSGLQGLRYHRGNAVPKSIAAATQHTRFRLHERGAEVRVEAAVVAIPFASEPPTVPRNFSYNRPFFVFLWRDGAEWPYFGAWIGDNSALKPFSAPKP